MPPVFALLGTLLTSVGSGLAPVLSGIGSAVGIGEGIANLTGGGTPGTPAATPPGPVKPGGPTPSQVSTATSAGSNLIAQTGGGLSPEALAQLVGMLDTSGQSFGGAGQNAANTIYGTPG